MNTEQTIEQLGRVTMTIPKHWPDHPAVKVPKGILRMELTYVFSKKHYKLKAVFSTSNRDISGTGTTPFEAASNMFKEACKRGSYGPKVFANHEVFLT